MSKFESFVVLAEMRTGSNLLEAALNGLPGVTCHGEAFNPVLIGYPKRDSLLGLTLPERDANPRELWKRIRKAEGLNGCRYFHDHDPRVLEPMLEDPKCAKIILTRNPIESYVSLQIARSTGQWMLGDAKSRRAAQIAFDAPEFEAHLATLQAFQVRLMRALQVSGQTAFYIDYEDAQDLAVLKGLAKWLGVGDGPDALPDSLKVQNPEPLEDKVANFAQMEASLARLDRFNLSRTPNFEPRRGPNVPGFIGAEQGGSGLLHMPLRPAPDAEIRAWLDAIGPLSDGFSQKTLRQWKRQHPGHRSFTVLRHPVMRVHLAFDAVLTRDGMEDTREVLSRRYRIALPDAATDVAGYGQALVAFATWLKANLNTQTSLPVHQIWASQSAALQGFAGFAAPDLLLREDHLHRDLAFAAEAAGVTAPAPIAMPADPARHPLEALYSEALEAAVRDAYTRDYMQFGFGPWRG